MDDLRPWRLLEHELFVAERLVHVEFHDVERDVIFLFGPLDLNAGGKQHFVVILVVGIPGIGDQRALLVVNQLTVRQQIKPAENDFSGEPTVCPLASNYVDDIIRLLVLMTFLADDGFGSVLEHRGLILWINFTHQQRVINDLRAQIFQRLLWIRSHDVIAADDKTVLGGNPNLKLLAVAHHVEGATTDDWQQTDHAQHRRLARQHVAADLLVFNDLSLFSAADRGVNIDRGLHGPNVPGLGIDVGNQLRLGGRLQRKRADVLLHLTRAEEASTQQEGGQKNEEDLQS